MWVSEFNTIEEIDEDGQTIMKLDVEFGIFGRHTVTRDGNLLFLRNKEERKAVVVVNKVGRHRFTYRGNHSLPEFRPRGVSTDAFGHILVCNHSYHDPSVHLLDENGHFLTSLLTKHRIDEDLP